MLTKTTTAQNPDQAVQIATKIIRSPNRRRSMVIQIHPEKGVIIRAPLKASNDRIEKFFKEKLPWIKKSLIKIQTKKSKIPKYNFIPGEKFPYLGELTQLPVYKRQDVINWYKEKAKNFLTQRTEIFAKLLAQKTSSSIFNPTIRTPKVLVKSFKSRWGVCSRSNVITYNWKIILAPIPIINYLVCHELVHIIHKNHSRRFYKTLSSLDPDFKIHQKWLRENSMALTI
jgi:predicted metal-dependent hydrolase